MEHIIQFQGLTLDKSDRLSELGELSFCEGVENRNGVIRPTVLNGTEIGRLHVDGQAAELLFVHTTDAYSHYIGRYDNKLYYFVKKDDDLVCKGELITGDVDVSSLSSSSFATMGNTISVNDPQTFLSFLVWRPASQSYSLLGQRPDIPKLEFYPKDEQLGDKDLGYPCHGVDKRVNDTRSAWASKKAFTSFTGSDIPSTAVITNAGENGFLLNSQMKFPINPAVYQAVNNAMWGIINETHATISERNHLYAPVYLRYCFRMYDGAMVSHSVPVLVGKSIQEIPQVMWENLQANPNGAPGIADYQLVSSNLFPVESSELSPHQGWSYTVEGYTNFRNVLSFQPMEYSLGCRLNTNDLKYLEQWQDVIESLDVFISAPITNYDQSKLATEFVRFGVIDNYSYSLKNGLGRICTVNSNGHPETFGINKYGINLLSSHSLGLRIPCTYPDDDYEKRFSKMGNLYKVASIPLKDLINRTSSDGKALELNIKDGVIKNITLQERMRDSDLASSSLRATGQFVYNNRLNIFGISETITSKHNWNDIVQPFHLSQDQLNNPPKVREYPWWQLENIHIQVQTDTDLFLVPLGNNGETYDYTLAYDIVRSVPLFFNLPNAKKIQLRFKEKNPVVIDGNTIEQTSTKYLIVDMEESSEINGSQTIPSSMRMVDDPEIDEDRTTFTSSSNHPNFIYTSEANNPFVFPPDMRNQIGTGVIYGLSSTTKALSQGQFGQFPLMAFCSDAIWALSVGDDGKFRAVNPISREVVATKEHNGIHSASSITQLNQAILFATSRGLNIITESDVKPISDSLMGETTDVTMFVNLLPGSIKDAFPALRDSHSLSDIPVINGSTDVIPLYDYANHRVFIFPDRSSWNGGAKVPCLVFSAESGAYSTMYLNDIMSFLNGYPCPYIQSTDGIIRQLDVRYKWDDPTLHPGLLLTRSISFEGLRSTVRSFRYSKDINDGSLLLAIFGSNDNSHYTFLGATCRDHSDYLPGYPFRYFRVLVALNMSQRDTLTALHLGIDTLHGKL